MHLTCLTSSGDARTVSARICGSADLVSRDLPGLRLGWLCVPETCQDRGSGWLRSPASCLSDLSDLVSPRTCRQIRLIIVPWFRQFAARVACVTPETCQGIDGYDRGTNRWYFQRILSFFYLIMIFSYFIWAPLFFFRHGYLYIYLFSYARFEYRAFIQVWFQYFMQALISVLLCETFRAWIWFI